ACRKARSMGRSSSATCRQRMTAPCTCCAATCIRCCACRPRQGAIRCSGCVRRAPCCPPSPRSPAGIRSRAATATAACCAMAGSCCGCPEASARNRPRRCREELVEPVSVKRVGLGSVVPGGCPVSLQEAMRLRTDHVVAVCASLAINTALLACLLAPMPVRQRLLPGDGAALQVVWIQAPPDLPSARDREGDRLQPWEASSSSADAGRRDPPSRLEAPSTPSAEAPAMASAGARPGSLDLSLPEGRIDYRSNPMSRGRAPPDPTRDRLNVQMIDSTLGGRMRGMAQAMACGDLERALQQARESTAGIVRAMERLGC